MVQEARMDKDMTAGIASGGVLWDVNGVLWSSIVTAMTQNMKVFRVVPQAIDAVILSGINEPDAGNYALVLAGDVNKYKEELATLSQRARKAGFDVLMFSGRVRKANAIHEEIDDLYFHVFVKGGTSLSEKNKEITFVAQVNDMDFTLIDNFNVIFSYGEIEIIRSGFYGLASMGDGDE